MQKKPSKFLFFTSQITIWIFTFFLLQACANYKIHYAAPEQASYTLASTPQGKLTHTMFLIGDAGNAAPGSIPPAVALLQDKLKAVSDAKNASVVFLGDNLYPNGFAPKREEAERAIDEYRLKVQLDAVKDFPGRIFFVAGNHDWYTWGIQGLKQEKKFIEEYLGREDVWLPKPGCGDPVEVELNKDLVLILLDSEWYLTDWTGHTEINSGCEVKSRTMFQLAFDEVIKSNRNKNIVVAMHHPPYTYGSHGGQFTARDHFLPLMAVNRKLRVPLPGLGSVYPFMRSAIGSRQDVAYPDYKALRNTLIASARKNGSFIFASGHEHTLQYIERDEQSFIVSGSGSKISPVKLGEGAEFAYGYYGLAEMTFYENGAVWVKYWTTEGENGKGKIVFQKQIKEALPQPAPPTRDSFAEYYDKKETVTKPLSAYDYEKSGIWRSIWGEHYRKVYATPIEVPKLDLSKYAGGLKPTKMGGGYQSNSLRLEDSQGREYAIRSIEKDPNRTAPYPFNESFVTELIRDNFSATHPLGALPVTKLSEAARIYHTASKLFYVPKQPALGDYNETFGNAFYLLEIRPDGDWAEANNFGNPADFESTIDVVEKITEDHNTRLDRPAIVRARLFDLLIGDWDRHDDQWRWGEYKQGDRKVYRPIPRDRDQAFSKYDGLMLRLVRPFVPLIRPLRPYSPTVKDTRWESFGARFFDPTFLNAQEWSVWEKEVKYLQQQLSDSIIENAFRETFPSQIYALNAPEMIQILKTRRDNLMDIARRHYEHVAKKVNVLGTNKRDLFEIIRLNNDSTYVAVYDTDKDGVQQEKVYERIFLTKETQEIRLYGLDNNDIFSVSGKVDKGILLRIVGSLGEDVFIDNSDVAEQSLRTIVYDAKAEKSKLEIKQETKIRITNDPYLNTYVRRAPDYEYNYGFRFPFLNANPDDGLLAGLNAQYITYGFKKSPYATKHAISGRYAFETSGWSFRYTGEFIDIFRRWDLLLDTKFNTPLYAINFYGFGNETPNYEKELRTEEDEDFAENYVRVRQRLFTFQPALLRRINSAFSWSIGPTFESIRIDSTAGRLIDEYTDDFQPELFDGLEFLGLRLRLDIGNLDNQAFPTRGFGWHFDTGWKMQLDNAEKNFPFMRASLAIYQRLTFNARLVLATRVGFMHNFNDNFEFYQGATLGSGFTEFANFRGVRRERFTGQTSFYHNTDLRLRLVNSTNRSVPFAMGIFGGADYGRVWVETEDSKVWHYAYGGGIFFTPFNLLTIQASLFRSDDNQNRFTLGGGFFF